MRVDFRNFVGDAICFQSAVNRGQASEFAVAVLYLVPILRDFLGKVGVAHQVSVKEDFSDRIAFSLEDGAFLVHDRPPDVVCNRFFKGVRGFGVKYDKVHCVRIPFF